MKARGTTSNKAALLLLTGTTVLASIRPPFVAVPSQSSALLLGFLLFFLFSIPLCPLSLLHLCSALFWLDLWRRESLSFFAFYPLPWWVFCAAWLANHAVILNGIDIFRCKYIEYFIFRNGQWKVGSNYCIMIFSLSDLPGPANVLLWRLWINMAMYLCINSSEWIFICYVLMYSFINLYIWVVVFSGQTRPLWKIFMISYYRTCYVRHGQEAGRK